MNKKNKDQLFNKFVSRIYDEIYFGAQMQHVEFGGGIDGLFKYTALGNGEYIVWFDGQKQKFKMSLSKYEDEKKMTVLNRITPEIGKIYQLRSKRKALYFNDLILKNEIGLIVSNQNKSISHTNARVIGFLCKHGLCFLSFYYSAETLSFRELKELY